MQGYIELCVAAAAGISSHLVIFINGEYHMQASMLMCISLSVLGILFITKNWESGEYSERNQG